MEVKELDNLVKQIRAKASEHADVKSHATLLWNELEELKGRMVEALMNLGRTSFSSPYGSVSIVTKESVRVPQEPEDREAFFSYLKEKGLFDGMATVHSSTLNSWYNDEITDAVEREKILPGEQLKIPGLKEIKTSTVLSVRKPK